MTVVKLLKYVLLAGICFAVMNLSLKTAVQTPIGGSTAPQTRDGKWNDNKKAASMGSVNYKEEMISLIEEISVYAKAKNRSFQVFGNNGLDLFRAEEVGTASVQRLLSSVDGVIMEGFFYGWEMQDDRRTPSSVRNKLLGALAVPIDRRLPILNIDYCQDRHNVDRAYQAGDQQAFVNFAADSRQLDRIPQYPLPLNRENSADVRNLQQVKNFLVLFNPDQFPTKQGYLDSLRDTNYDLIIIDMYYQGEALSAGEVASLKVKKNGAARLVFSYMSVGEAEDYRGYWQKSWSKSPPAWVAEQNPDWPGNFKVKYWAVDWKGILFGSPGAYLDMILDKGFDGAFLDVIDAFEYFEG